MKYIIITTATLFLALLLTQLITAYTVSDTPSTPYTVIKKYEGFEVRLYPETTVASTTLPDASFREVSRIGFRRIAGYIFGNNKTNAKIAMTSPVQMEMGCENQMSFFMPDNLQLGELPLPNDNLVHIETQPQWIVATIQFSGWASDEILAKKYKELKGMLDHEGIHYKSGYKFLGYNPPYQLVNRKNEVAIEIYNDEYEL